MGKFIITKERDKSRGFEIVEDKDDPLYKESENPIELILSPTDVYDLVQFIKKSRYLKRFAHKIAK
jgi:hypothetical protein